MEEVNLKPGWLRKDTKRAAERIKEWELANDERRIRSTSCLTSGLTPRSTCVILDE